MSSADDQLLQLMEMEAKLTKIRSQINSKLENQQQLALVLQAIEENLQEQGQSKTPVTYFVSFLSLLDQSSNGDIIQDTNLATCALYFLDLVSSYTPKTLLKSKFREIISRIAPALSNVELDAPLIRSSIGVLESLLVVQDHSGWTNSKNLKVSPERGLEGLLELSIDPRPKIRKRAQEAIGKVLSAVPAGPSLEHPAAFFTGSSALQTITSLLQEQQTNKKSNNKETNSQLIHNLQLITVITNTNQWPLKLITPLCDVLLEVSKSSDQYLISSAFSSFEGLFNSMTNEIDNDKFVKVLDVMFDLKPALNDQHLAPSWLAVIAKAVTSYSNNVDSLKCFLKLPEIFKTVGEFFKSEVQNICISASQCLIAILVNSVDTKLLLSPPAVKANDYEQVTKNIESLANITLDFMSVKYKNCTKEVCELVANIFSSLKIRASPAFIPHLKIVGDWRSTETDGFELNEVAENVIAMAISSVGPEVVLEALPLNLNIPNAVGRAWLLPILRDNVKHASLGYYIKNLLPLTDFFQNKISTVKADSMNAKVFATIIDQIWSLLPHFCDLPNDLPTSFNPTFAGRLANILYENVALRTTICHALRLLVESNLAYSTGEFEEPLLNQQFPIEKSKEYLNLLSTKIAQNILKVLFNVFVQTPTEQRGFILESIDVYLKISTPENLVEIFDNVCATLNEELQKENKGGKKTVSDVKISMMDLIVLMAKYLPVESHNALFAIFNQTVSYQDVQIQKRSYRILSNLVETSAGLKSALSFISNILEILIKSADTTSAAAKAARFGVLQTVVKNLPAEYPEFIPSILPEVIINTKNVNEKTRETSYQILIAMGYKMNELEGTVMKGPDGEDHSISLKEFFVMCSAGLAGNPTMISAAITSLSCLFYEFHQKLDTELLTELTSTIELHLSSRSREVVKSALGFMKVAVLSLPEDMITSNIKGILTSLVTVNHEHKGPFKSKIKHIIERLIRKFGIDLIEQNIPEEDKKLIVNIKKSKARAKRKQAEGEAEVGDSTPATGANSEKVFMSAYEAALYGDSESEGDDDDDDDEDEKPKKGRKNKKGSKKFILESKDAPLDLLDRKTLQHITSSKPKKFTKKNLEETSNFKTKNGKIVISEKNGDDDDISGSKNSIDAYVEAITQGPVRGQRNKLKFKKGSKEEGIDWNSDDEDSKPNSKKGGFRANKKGKISKPQPKFKARKKL